MDHKFRRIPSLLVVIGVPIAVIALSGGSPAPRPTSIPQSASVGETQVPPIRTALASSVGTGDRLREGAKITGEMGTFDIQGDRATFIATSSKRKLACLENLALERVSQIVTDNQPNQVEWQINGTITEFRDTNYLLLTEAVLKTKPGRTSNP